MLIDGSLTNGFLFVNRGIVVDIDQIMNVSTTMIIQPGPVVDFLIANQNVRDPYRIVCAKNQPELHMRDYRCEGSSKSEITRASYEGL
ncbi:hypothetical protein FRX31_003242 [Thalictrum thalictroides]|uniref:Uncharacterized protein n=1 Tax=Thalictrum thalictroides TaxID=46969 RepID=A0A7J6XC17_THATH|nr:hypothetical protein FRX31_003242 [Thalictrum thalictroides]